MAIDIKLPLINGKTDAEQIYQIKRYLYQLAEELKYNLNTLEAGTSDLSSIEKVGIIDSLNKWRIGIQGDIGSIANIRQTVSSQGATITALTDWKKDAVNSISKIDQISDADYASLTGLAQYKTDTSDVLSSITQRVTAAEATIETLTKINEGDVESLANIVSKVTANEANIAALTEWKSGAIDSISKIDQRVSANASGISSLTEWKNGVVGSIAKVDQISSADYASITGLAEYKKGTSDSIARVEGKADANASSISTLAKWQGDVSGEISSIASIKALAEANKASVGILVDNGAVKGSILIGAINDESVAKISADRLDIEGKTLNIKVDATNISGVLTIGQLPGAVAKTSDLPTNVSDLANDAGYQTSSGVNTIVEGKGYQTASGVNSIVEGKGYQTESGVVSIVNGRITADYIKALGLEVGNHIKMGENATISWDNVGSKPTNLATTTDVTNAQNAAISAASTDATTKANGAKSAAVTEVKGLGYQTASDVNGIVDGKGYQTESQVTTITKNTISTTNILAQYLRVRAAYIDGTITANQIDATNLKVKAANIDGTLTASQIKVTDIYTLGATLGGFTIDSNSMHTQMGTSRRILLCSGTSASYKVGDFTSRGWSILAGDNFGVLQNGTMYAKDAVISGTLTTGANVDDKEFGVKVGDGFVHVNSNAFYDIPGDSGQVYLLLKFNTEDGHTWGLFASGPYDAYGNASPDTIFVERIDRVGK